LLFLLFAFFNAWREQRIAREASEKQLRDALAKLDELTIPRLSGQFNIYPTQLSKTGDSGTTLIVGGTIKNEGAPTIIMQWKLELRFSDGSVITGEKLLPPPPEGHITVNQPGGSSPMVIDELIFGNVWRGMHLLQQEEEQPDGRTSCFER
jgi:hypothetical protein